jgi:murein DD-endopeptidase MepM/ murein hydrolase activator NlpD
MGAADLARTNGLSPADVLDPGRVLLIPIPEGHVGSDVLLVPDSGLLNGPGAAGFDVEAYAQAMPGYLKRHRELIEKRVTMTGPQIVQMVASRHSVDPRLLLAVLEYRSAWLSDPAPSGDAFKFPAGKRYDETDPQAQEDYGGLFGQLAWTANRLNAGYYGWQAGGLNTVEFADGSHAYLAAGLNAGTAGVQSFLALESDWATWQGAVRPAGFMNTYTNLFGDPWPRAAETVPPGLVQPEFALPWAAGETWYLTGGPHRAWGADTPWASLDFVADPQSIGCGVSTYWARAIAPGVVVRVDYGQVAVDLDGDGHEETGWTVLYLHMAPEGRVEVGTRLETGDPIGHPSCEGGRSTGAHVHVARRYNGEWLSADGPIPFVMDGWTPVAGAVPYDGYLTKDGIIAWACTCRAGNLITAGP